jgi:hypothetical protein
LQNKNKEKQYAARYANKYPNRRLVQVAKHRARKRGIPFDLSYEDVVVPVRCPILGIPLVPGTGKSGRQGGNKNSPSLDRIDGAKGYVRNNVQVISHLANSMKGAATREELLLFANWALRTYGN